MGGGAFFDREYKELISQPRIYNKMDKCLEVCKENNESKDLERRRLDGTYVWRPFAIDIPPKKGTTGGPKQYIAAPIKQFCECYEKVPHNKRNAYEIIDLERHCWAYFDLEYSRALKEVDDNDDNDPSGSDQSQTRLNVDVNGDALTQLVTNMAVTILHEKLNAARQAHTDHTVSGPRLKPEGDEGSASRSIADAALAQGTLVVESLVLDSHREDKYSRHLILRPHLTHGQTRIPMPLAGTLSAGALAQTVCERLGDQLKVEAKGEQSSVAAAAAGGGGPAPAGEGKFVDLGVYTKSRCFRLVYSSKVGSNARLVINDGACENLPADLCAPNPLLSTRAMHEQIKHTLVNPELSPKESAWVTLTMHESMAAAASRRGGGGGGGGGDGGGGGGGPRQPQQGGAGPSGAGPSGAAAGPDGGDAGGANHDGGGDSGGGDGGGGASDLARWIASYDGKTDTPLLDLPGGLHPQHPYVRCTRTSKVYGGKAPPAPFDGLARWAVEEFQRWGHDEGKGPGASSACGIKAWTYIRSEHPAERLLHMTAEGTRYCFCRGRQHASNLTMLTIDLNLGVAYQRCWDRQNCIVRGVNGVDMVKAKHRLPRRPPAGALPTVEEMDAFERETEKAAEAVVVD